MVLSILLLLQMTTHVTEAIMLRNQLDVFEAFKNYKLKAEKTNGLINQEA